MTCGQVWWPILGNLCSAFNPFKCTHTVVNTHTVNTHRGGRSRGQPMLRRPGSSWGFGALLKGLTLVVVLKVERKLVIHSLHQQFLPDPRLEPALYPLGHDCPWVVLYCIILYICIFSNTVIMYSIWKRMCFLNIKACQHILLHQIHQIMIFKKASYDPFKTVDNFPKCNSECATHRWVGYTNHL